MPTKVKIISYYNLVYQRVSETLTIPPIESGHTHNHTHCSPCMQLRIVNFWHKKAFSQNKQEAQHHIAAPAWTYRFIMPCCMNCWPQELTISVAA